MARIKKQTPRRMLALLLVIALLAISLLLVACGARSNASNLNGSNISTGGTTQQTPTPGGTNDLRGANQQVQTAVSAVDGANNDVNNADSSSNNDNGQQP